MEHKNFKNSVISKVSAPVNLTIHRGGGGVRFAEFSIYFT